MRKYLLILVLALSIGLVSVSLASAAPGLQGGGKVHYVTFGETLHSIATYYGVTTDAILRHNGIRNPNLIYVGQPLVIPTGYGHPTGYGGPATTHACANRHVVVAGETLSDVAYRYGVTVNELLRFNDIYNSDMVYAGQTICVSTGGQPGYTPQPTGYQGQGMPPNAHYHTVVGGESLHYLAGHYGVDYMEIVRANNLANASMIQTGQRLHIPGYEPAPPPAKPAHNYGPAEKPGYSQPVAGPLPIPEYYDDSYDEAVVISGSPPAAPGYQPSPVLPLLPEADHPLEVVVNGGAMWVGEVVTPYDDPAGVTTLIVSIAEKDKVRVARAQSGDYRLHSELGLIPEFGVDKFRAAFKYIPPGDYDVWLVDTPDPEHSDLAIDMYAPYENYDEDNPTHQKFELCGDRNNDGTIDDPLVVPSERVPVKLEPGKRVEVMFRKGLGFSGPTFASPDGWVLAEWDNPSVPCKNLGGWSNILVHTPASGLWVKIESEGGGYKAKCLTGAKGPGACDFAGLSAGFYWIQIDGTDLTVKTYMDGNVYATFNLARQPTAHGENIIGPVSYD
jgi:LysM repeat protein